MVKKQKIRPSEFRQRGWIYLMKCIFKVSLSLSFALSLARSLARTTRCCFCFLFVRILVVVVGSARAVDFRDSERATRFAHEKTIRTGRLVFRD